MNINTNQDSQFAYQRLNVDMFKGTLSDAFQYSDMKFTKKGKDIKKKLESKKTELEAVKTTRLVELEAAKEKCPETPTQKLSDYRYQGFKEQIGEMFGFSYEQLYPSNGSSNSSYGYDTIKSEDTPGENCYRCYMDCLDRYIEACVDVATVTVLVNNLDDNKSYDLNQRQILALGGFEKAEESTEIVK